MNPPLCMQSRFARENQIAQVKGAGEYRWNRKKEEGE